MNTLNHELHAAGLASLENDQLLAAILRESGDCIKILDREGRLAFMSDGGKRTMEVDDFSKIKGCYWPAFWEGTGNREAEDALHAARCGQVAHFSGPANTAKGTPRRWEVTVSPIFAADGSVSHLLSISRDITDEWQADTDLRDAIEREKFLAAELQHRMKNTIALVVAIANQSFTSSPDDPERSAFFARLNALNATHDLLNEANWSGATIADVVEKSLGPHRSAQDRLHASGPPIELNPRQAVSLALSLHELATNATKYGSLSNERGRVDIHWSLDGGNAEGFRFVWVERGGPAITQPPTRKGFGTRMLERVLKHDFRAQVSTRYEPQGLTFELVTTPASLNA
ncbi:MAG TPA: HWE histidine kinase domain-containing protein [Rhizomicrobium sp.]